jgi:hypothetical protein
MDLSHVSKRFCEITAEIAMHRVSDDACQCVIDNALLILSRLNSFSPTQEFVEFLFARLRNHFIRKVHMKGLRGAMETLNSIDRLPKNATIPENDSLSIIKTVWSCIRTNPVLQYRYPSCVSTAIIISLSRVPPLARIPDTQHMDLVRIIRDQAVRDIQNYSIHSAAPIVRYMSSDTRTPKKYLTRLVETILQCVSQSIRYNSFHHVPSMLGLLSEMPLETTGHNTRLFDVVQKIRRRFAHKVAQGNFGGYTISMLFCLHELSLNPKFSETYFFDAMETL